MRLIVFFVALFLIPSFLFSQEKIDTSFVFGKQSIQYDFTKDEIKTATENVLKLRQTPIVVRLKTNKKQIAAYRKSGDKKTADKIEQKSFETNLIIISACVKYFNYTKIYFLDTDDATFFRETDTLLVSNYIAEKEQKIVINHDSVYYLDLGQLYNRVRINDWKYKEYGVTEEGNQLISDHAFVLRNSEGEQLAPPTPFYDVVNFGGGKKGKTLADPIADYIQIDKLTGNSLLKESLKKVNEIDASILRMNARLYQYLAKITMNPSLAENYAAWYENNPNHEYYPLWIQIEKKLQSIESPSKKFTNQY